MGGRGARVWTLSRALVEKVLERVVSRHREVSVVSVLRAGLLGRGEERKEQSQNSGKLRQGARCDTVLRPAHPELFV